MDMTTGWTVPSSISQYAELNAENIHIPWVDSEFDALKDISQRSVSLNGTLSRIARAPKADVTNKSYFIQCEGFNFANAPEQITGINLKLTVNRRARITDDTVQLLLNGSPIGNNLGQLKTDQIIVYGGNLSAWGITDSNLSLENLGVLLRFKSHPQYPHRDGVWINSVELQIF
jgi:hypothetical protein